MGGTDRMVNQSSFNYIAMLFASVDGISKVGYYTGNGGSGQTITTGFAPRFVIIRRTNTVELYLNQAAVGNTVSNNAPTSNGFTLSADAANVNGSGDKYIYYAHA